MANRTNTKSSRSVFALLFVLAAIVTLAVTVGRSPRLQELLGVDTREGYEPTAERLTRLRMIALTDAIGEYREQYSQLPASLNALLALSSTNDARHPKPEWFVDGWGRDFLFRVVARRYLLRSSGPDQLPDTDDDVEVRGP